MNRHIRLFIDLRAGSYTSLRWEFKKEKNKILKLAFLMFEIVVSYFFFFVVFVINLTFFDGRKRVFLLFFLNPFFL